MHEALYLLFSRIRLFIKIILITAKFVVLEVYITFKKVRNLYIFGQDE